MHLHMVALMDKALTLEEYRAAQAAKDAKLERMLNILRSLSAPPVQSEPCTHCITGPG